MLKAVIEQDDVGTKTNRLLATEGSISSYDNRYSGEACSKLQGLISGLVDSYLVVRTDQHDCIGLATTVTTG